MKLEHLTPVSHAIEEVLEIFASDLAPVKFGDLEASVLRAASDEVGAAASAVSRAQVALEEARGELEQKQEALLLLAHRAVAYARIYAENDPTLTARLEGIALPRSARRAAKADSEPTGAAPSASGRSRKVRATEPVEQLAIGT